jgi:hypothetical protein
MTRQRCNPGTTQLVSCAPASKSCPTSTVSSGNYPPQSPRQPSSGPTGTLLQRSRNFAGIQRNAHSTTEHPTTPRHYTSIGTNRQRNHPRRRKSSPLQQANGIHSRRMHITTCCPRLVRIRTGRVLRPILHHAHQVPLPQGPLPTMGTHVHDWHNGLLLNPPARARPLTRGPARRTDRPARRAE